MFAMVNEDCRAQCCSVGTRRVSRHARPSIHLTRTTNDAWPMAATQRIVLIVALHRLKNREGLSWFARTASTLLLQRVKEKKSLKVQARSETLGTKPREYEQYQTADIAIWDCCLYYKTELKGEVVLLSNDTNLRLLCESEELGVS